MGNCFPVHNQWKMQKCKLGKQPNIDPPAFWTEGDEIVYVTKPGHKERPSKRRPRRHRKTKKLIEKPIPPEKPFNRWDEVIKESRRRK